MYPWICLNPLKYKASVKMDGALKQGVIDSLGREKDATFIDEAGQVEKISTQYNFSY